MTEQQNQRQAREDNQGLGAPRPPVTTLTIEQIIARHEALEQLTSDMVQFLVDINEALIDVTGHPSGRANALLDRYFSITDAP